MALRAIAGGRSGSEPHGSGPARRSPDPSLLRDLYVRYAAAVHGRCRYLLRDEEAARDATQEVFARALAALPAFRAAAAPLTWMLRIATHHCLNLRRGAQVASRERLREWLSFETEAGPGQDAVASRELLRALLASATLEAQEVAVMYYVDELTQAEIAETAGLSLPTVRKRLRQFLQAARRALAEALPDHRLPAGVLSEPLEAIEP